MSIAEDIIASGQQFATVALNNAVQELSMAMSIVQSLGRAITTGGPPPFTINTPAPHDPGDVPEYKGKHYVGKAFTGQKPVLQDPGPLNLPPDPRDAPDPLPYNDPPKPSGEPNFGAVSNPPSLNPPPPPPPPPDLMGQIAALPVPPVHPITVPPPPAYLPPEFTGTPPTFDTPMPTALDQLMRDEYEGIAPVMRAAVAAEFDAFMDREFPSFRPGMAAIETRLNKYLQGGTALTAAVENAIYNRTLDKTNTEGMRAARKAYGEAAKRGHTLISVALTAQQMDLDQMRRDGNVRAAIDIAVKQAELEQANMQFAVTQSSTLRKMALDAGMAYYSGLVTLNGQAIEYAKEVVAAVVQAYELAIKHAELQCRIYEAEARIYETKLKGALAVYDAYAALMKGLEAQANVDMALVSVYKARIDAVTAQAMVYRAQIEGTTALVEIEKLKIEIYQAQVQAVTAETAMYVARWNGYEAAVRGESAKQVASGEQAKAYQARVAAYSEIVRARATALNAVSTTNEQKTKVYQVDVEAYGTLTHAELEGVNAEIQSFESTLKGYEAEAHARAEYDRALIASYEASMRLVIEQIKLFLDQVREQDKLEVARADGIGKIAVEGARGYAGLASASMSGMNSLAANVNNVTG